MSEWGEVRIITYRDRAGRMRADVTGSVGSLAIALLALATVLAAVLTVRGPGGLAVPSASTEDSTTLARDYARLPQSFEPNRGQTDPRVDFLSRGRGYSLFLSGGDATLALSPGARGSREGVVHMSFAGADPSPVASGDARLPGTVNYLRGRNPAGWHTGIRTFRTVTYRGLYPGVDLRYSGTQGRLEYDLILAPGVDPSLIALDFRGAGGLSRARNGDLLVHLGDTTIRERAPVAFQWVAGERHAVPARYVVHGHRASFALGHYDHSRPLVIDPIVLAYSTYLGGNNVDEGNAIAVDSAGAAYVTGETSSTNFPTTAGAFETSRNGNTSDAFVAKLAPNGQSLAYSTYLGGATAQDGGLGIAVDSVGAAYLTGFTSSSDFPTTAGALDTTRGGFFDAFAAKLAPNGQSLDYSTYLGGGDRDVALAIAIDSGGGAYLTGDTNSSDFPATAGAVQATYAGHHDGFVTKLAPSGQTLAYSTYLGGGGLDRGLGIAVDSAGAAYVTGNTPSRNFPTTSGAFDTSAGGADAFVTKIAPNGQSFGYSTHLGGDSVEEGTGIAIDSAGAAYLTGDTSSSDFPTTTGAFDTTLDGNTDAYAAKLAPSGGSLAYGTLLGGDSFDEGFGIAVDSDGVASLTGETNSHDFPTTSGAFDSSLANSIDTFVAKLSPSGQGLPYATYLGGTHDDLPRGIAVDPGGSAYVTGWTESTNFPTTAGAFDTTHGANRDAFVSKLSGNVTPDLALSKSDSPDIVAVGGTLTYTLRVENLSSTDDATGVTISDTLPGSVTFGSASAGCTNGGGTVTCELGTIVAGAAKQVQIQVTPTQAGTITNDASVAADQTDPAGANNQASEQTTAVVCTITGSPAGETLVGTSGDDVICAGGGNDTLDALAGNDVLLGEGGRDALIGRSGDDTMDGGAAVDTALYRENATSGIDANLGTGAVTSDGHGGQDTLVLADPGLNTVENATGTRFADEIVGDSGANSLTGRQGADNLTGDDGNDLLRSGDGDDSLQAGSGNDKIAPGTGGDSIDGGPGSDTLRYGEITGGGVTVDFTTGTVTGAAGTDFFQLDTIENVDGTPQNDTLTALLSGTRSVVNGFAGNDTMRTDDGDPFDSIHGGDGTDNCVADAGDTTDSC